MANPAFNAQCLTQSAISPHLSAQNSEKKIGVGPDSVPVAAAWPDDLHRSLPLWPGRNKSAMQGVLSSNFFFWTYINLADYSAANSATPLAVSIVRMPGQKEPF